MRAPICSHMLPRPPHWWWICSRPRPREIKAVNPSPASSMGRMVRVAWRLISLTLALVCIFELHKSTMAVGQNTQLTVFDTVYMNCVLVLVSLLYYSLAKFIHLSCCQSNPPIRKRTTLTWPMSRHVNHNPTLEDEPAVIQDVPVLSLHNVWILVYGLGMVFFVTGYCMLGLHPVCMACVGVAMGVLCLDELICPRFHVDGVYILMRYSSLLVGIISLLLVSADAVGGTVITYVTTLDLYSIVFGLCFPFLSQFIMLVVRDAKGFSLGNAVQVCEFGFPFAAFLGVFHLSVAYGQRFQMSDTINEQLAYHHSNYTTTSTPPTVHIQEFGGIRTETPVILFYGLTPMLIIPCLFMYITCTLEGCTIDPLLSLSMALCIQHLILSPSGPTSVLGVYGTVCCAIASVIRVAGEHKFAASRPPPPSLQMESIQLPHNVVWGRHSTVEWERNPVVAIGNSTPTKEALAKTPEEEETELLSVV